VSTGAAVRVAPSGNKKKAQRHRGHREIKAINGMETLRNYGILLIDLSVISVSLW
jgi:hypothetical protein